METFKNMLTGKNFMRNLLAIFVVAVGFTVIFAVLFGDIPESKNNTVNLILGFVFGAITMVSSFYFGTSQSSTEKNEMLKDRL